MKKEKFPKKIFCPIDGSVSSLMAQETVVEVAKKTGADVTVLHVIPPLLGIALQLDYSVPTATMKDILNFFEQKADKILSDAESFFGKEGVTIDVKKVIDSHPANSIVELSERDYDLIVIGARGEHEKDPYSLGSITIKVTRHASCPILIVKKTTALSNMLVYLDGSENSVRAADYAAKLAEKLDSKITLLCVQLRRLFDLSPESAEDMCERIFSKALDAIGRRELRISKAIEFGHPSNIIAETAKKGKHDLIVLGRKGLGTIKRFLLGDVAESVSYKAECSVLMVP
ncbi:MAG: universal stress protein [Candidatus Hodarchaeota archaeon]